MKAKIIILVFILNVSQAYAWGSREQGLLLGFVGGVVATAVYQNHGGRAKNTLYIPPVIRQNQAKYNRNAVYPTRRMAQETRYCKPRKSYYPQVLKVERNHYYAGNQNRPHGERYNHRKNHDMGY